MMLSISLKLTERQKEVGLCLLQGMCTKAIANRFNISTSTVRVHQQWIKKRLSCQNTYQVGYKLALYFQSEVKKLNF